MSSTTASQSVKSTQSIKVMKLAELIKAQPLGTAHIQAADPSLVQVLTQMKQMMH